MAKKGDMKTKTDAELAKLLTDTREQLRAERFAAAGARPKDPSLSSKLRKTIARAHTEQHARAAKPSA